jgi:hypothetical protein
LGQCDVWPNKRIANLLNGDRKLVSGWSYGSHRLRLMSQRCLTGLTRRQEDSKLTEIELMQ